MIDPTSKYPSMPERYYAEPQSHTPPLRRLPDYYRVILDEVYSHGIGALFWVININAEDPWNLAISDEASLTQISETIKDYAIKSNERIQKVVRR
jgi:hypothetical protein